MKICFHNVAVRGNGEDLVGNITAEVLRRFIVPSRFMYAVYIPETHRWRISRALKEGLRRRDENLGAN